MFKKLTVIALVLLMLPMLTNAQENVILKSSGKMFKPAEAPGVTTREIQPLFDKKVSLNYKNAKKASASNFALGTDDTLNWGVPPSVNFGYFGQDRMVQWFEAPADMIIHAAGFNTAAVDAEGLGSELKLVKLVWTKDQILNAGVQRWGYYQAAGNTYNDATAFQDDADVTGDYVDVQGDGLGSPFGEDIWSDGGDGAPVVPAADGEYQWVEMNLLGFEPTVNAGDIIGVAMKNTGATMDADRIGFIADNTLGIPGFKFYANGRLDPPNDYGWWTRKYTWDFALAVTLTGDKAPDIADITVLGTTTSTDPRTVEATITDENPSGGDAGVASATLKYSIDDGATWNDVAMTNTSGDVYAGDIPGQAPGTVVKYYVNAVDVGGLESNQPTAPISYFIFLPTNGSLLIFNGLAAPGDGSYPQSFYLNTDDYPTNFFDPLPFDFRGAFDVWAYGDIPEGLLDNYRSVFEIATNGPTSINSEVVRAWLEGAPDRHYLLAGDEWLGTQTGWVNTTYEPGTFQKDILGISADYNDINYGASGDQLLPSIVAPVAGTALGGPLSDTFAANGDTMYYYPTYELGSSYTNWLDGADFESDVEVFMTATGVDGNTYNIAGSRKLSNGNDVVVMLFDPLSLDAPDAQYYWYGYDATAPHVVAAGDLFVVGIHQEDEAVPTSFSLSQNYPNPFNPTTTIKFTLPKTNVVKLKVYNVLGEEVANLVNKSLTAGSYSVDFNASALASGVYVYRIEAGDFVASKKMMLLK